MLAIINIKKLLAFELEVYSPKKYRALMLAMGDCHGFEEFLAKHPNEFAFYCRMFRKPQWSLLGMNDDPSYYLQCKGTVYWYMQAMN